MTELVLIHALTWALVSSFVSAWDQTRWLRILRRSMLITITGTVVAVTRELHPVTFEEGKGRQ